MGLHGQPPVVTKLSNHHAVHNKNSIRLISVIGHQPASGHPDESWQLTTLLPSTFYGQNAQFLPSLKLVSFRKTGGHPVCRHNIPSRTLKIHENDLVRLTRDPQVVNVLIPRHTDLSTTKTFKMCQYHQHIHKMHKINTLHDKRSQKRCGDWKVMCKQNISYVKIFHSVTRLSVSKSSDFSMALFNWDKGIDP